MKPYNCPCGGTLTITHHAETDEHEEYMEGNCEECWGIHVEAQYTDAIIRLWNEKIKELSR